MPVKAKAGPTAIPAFRDAPKVETESLSAMLE